MISKALSCSPHAKIVRFISEETDTRVSRLFMLAVVGGICNSLLLVIINTAAKNIDDGVIPVEHLMQYLLAFFLTIFAQRTAQRETINAVESGLQNVRVRLSKKLLNSSLHNLEQDNDVSRFSALSQSANMISQSAMHVIAGAEALIVIVFAGFYLLWLSPAGFLVAVVLIVITIFLLVQHYRLSYQELARASTQEGQFLSRSVSVLKGFKQLKLNQAHSQAIYAEMQGIAEGTYRLKSRANIRLFEDILFTNIMFYILLMVIVFFLPNLLGSYVYGAEVLFPIIATVLFMMEPVYTLSESLPNISKANVAVTGLYNLEEHLDVQAERPQQLMDCQPEGFKQILLHNVKFTYRNVEQQPLFTTGPVSLQIVRGETLFITGSNGSGKSTLIKLLTGLYCPESGTLCIDDYPVEAQHREHYRSIFASVFSDFHLFERVHGDPDPAEVKQWIDRLGLSGKTSFEEGRFTRKDLSTGQRKRLALITAIIQQRPVLVLDEFAADQDAAFRKEFYKSILPELTAMGKTLILITHDDQYFSHADRVIYLDAGQLSESDQ